MLGFVQGKIISLNPESQQCVLLMQRLGFELTLPKRLFETLAVNQKVALWIHTHVREDAITLFGFGTELEKQFFKQLIGVSGLGPRTALSLLGEHGAGRLIQLIIDKQTEAISEAPGVGKKLAQRLVLELAGKMDKWMFHEAVVASPLRKVSDLPAPQRQLRDDLQSALLHLGFVPTQVKNTLEKLLEGTDLEEQGFEICLKAALKEMSKMPHVSERN